jgi:hypothetical protein
MTKVAINRCFGGFGLSDQAFEKLLERKGIAFDRVETESKSKLMGNTYYTAGNSGNGQHYISEHDYYDNRADADLIAVIEEMGVAANSWAADIVIVTIPDNIQWHIDEYDGMEHVAENHRTWV